MNLKKDFSKEEWTNRVNLAACYHLADHFKMTDIIWNHITAKTSEQKETFETFFSTPHNLNFQAIAEMFELEYYRPESINSFEEEFLNSTQKNKSVVFEIITNRDHNPKQLKELEKKLMKLEFRPT